MAFTLKTLTRLQTQMFLKSKSKGNLYGDIFLVAYLWIIWFVVFVVLKKDGVEIPAPAIAVVAVGCTIPDLILKFVMVRDNSVMNTFLKTRPLSQSMWNRFLSLSQFWKSSNLLMPLILLPACFLFMPLLPGLLVFIFLYLASVLGGLIVMKVKHRGNYQPEKAMNSYLAGSVKSARGNYISGIQFRSFLRSKRLRVTGIYVAALFYLNCLILSFNITSDFVLHYLFLFLFLVGCSMPQWGFAIEANFFNGIWSRPIAIENLLAYKYRFGLVCGAVGALLCLPICIWNSCISPFDIVAIVLFCCCFGNMFMLIDAYNCVPFDMFGKAFFNYQGNSSTLKVSSLLVSIASMAIGIGSVSLLSGWKLQLVLSAFGIGGLIAYRPFFRWVVRRFMSNRYKYMEKYSSR